MLTACEFLGLISWLHAQSQHQIRRQLRRSDSSSTCRMDALGWLLQVTVNHICPGRQRHCCVVKMGHRNGLFITAIFDFHKCSSEFDVKSGTLMTAAIVLIVRIWLAIVTIWARCVKYVSLSCSTQLAQQMRIVYFSGGISGELIRHNIVNMTSAPMISTM